MADKFVNWPPSSEALTPLVRELARVTARVCHDLQIEPDMNDPEVAREMLSITFEAMFLTPAKRKTSSGRLPPRRRRSPEAYDVSKFPST